MIPASHIVDRAAIERAGFPAFVELWGRRKFGSHYAHARHLVTLAEQAERVFRGEKYVMLASLPPGSMKSFVLSRALPAWIWTIDPSYSFMRASYSANIANRFASDTREICESRWYRDRWGRVILGRHPLRPDGVNEYWTTANGFSLCSSIGSGQLVGRHAQMVIIDDPIAAQSTIAEQPKILDKTRTWFDAVATTRGAIGDVQRIICAAQRFHEFDLNGLLIDKYEGRDTFVHVMLPWHFEPERANPFDHRTTEGEELFDDRKTRHKVEDEIRFHGKTSPIYRSQYQQDPATGDAKYFPPHTLLDFTGAPPLSETFSVISVDPTFTGGLRADFMAIDVVGYMNGHFWTYYSEQVKRDFSSSLEAIKKIRSMFPTQFVLIEAAANGEALYNLLGREMLGVERVKPQGSKEQRAFTASRWFHAGRVHFDKSAPWYAEKERYLIRFPSPGEHDDTIDTTTQAINWLDAKYGGSAALADAMGGLGTSTTDLGMTNNVKTAIAIAGLMGPGSDPRELRGLAAQLAGFAQAASAPELERPESTFRPYESLGASIDISEFE